MYSRPLPEILDEVQRLIEVGYREVVLTGIHLGHYGVDFNRGKPKRDWTRLSHLVRRIVDLPGDFRVRLSSIEATEVTRELIDVMAEFPQRVCPHLHISMQSGSDTVLRRMHRRWGSARFVDRCRLVQAALDAPALTTDIIVGFPGETEAEFAETCKITREVGFSKIHIFPFSARRGTPAAEMEGQLPAVVKQERGRRLADLEAELQSRYFRSLHGRSLRVLIESTSDAGGDRVVGTSCRYAPVELSGNPEWIGTFRDVTAGSVRRGLLEATDRETACR